MSSFFHRRRGALLVAIVPAAVATVLASACSSETRSVYVGRATESPGFTTDGGADAAVNAPEDLTAYCPSSECPTNRTTCPTSRFRCDIDLMTDRENCGACGNVCPGAGPTGFLSGTLYDCIKGRCEMRCTDGLDCDGLTDNGCEVVGLNNEHCGACGNRCGEVDKPCLNRARSGTDLGCGCYDGDIFCATHNPPCVQATSDDANCGSCGNVCSPNEHDGAVPHDTMYFGCHKGKCGQLKCKPNLADCDGDVSNGCEASILTAENCGGCGIACAPGQECHFDPDDIPTCMCPAGETFCPTSCSEDGICQGSCSNLTADAKNCGTCGLDCGQQGVGVCNYGVCAVECRDGWADCNGNKADLCETYIDHDPRNCGGCGVVCDAVADQACVGGRCVVKPCDQLPPDAGEAPR